MIYCRKCGGKNHDDASFCRFCGNKLKKVKPSKSKRVLKMIALALPIFIGITVLLFLIIKPEINIMNYVTVSISGISPYATAEVNIDWDRFSTDYGDEIKFSGMAESNGINTGTNDTIYYMKQMITAELDQTEGLANGDELTCTICVSPEFSGVIENRIASGTDTYKISGLNTYVETLDDISKNDLMDLQEIAEDFFYDNSEISKYDSCMVDSFDYIGSELVTLKDPSEVSDYAFNRLYMIFKVIVHLHGDSTSNKNGYDGYTTFYWYCGFTDISLKENGELSVSDSDGTITIPADRFGVGYNNSYSWYLSGYKTLEAMETKILNNSLYNVESNVDPNAGAASKESGEIIESNVSSETSVIGKATVNVKKLRIRSKASTSGEKLGYAKKGKTYDVYEIKSGGGYTWYRIGEDEWIADDGTWITYQAS